MAPVVVKRRDGPIVHEPAAMRPNIILMVNDDLGYGDLGCYGCEELATPHLDALAARGTRLTRYYTAAPVCSAARAAILTGHAPHRAGVTGVLRQQHDAGGLRRDRPTLAERLRGAGYATGLVGKWHLGVGPGHRPLDRGFEQFYGSLSGVIDYWHHRSTGGGLDGQPGLYRGREMIAEQGYYSELLNRELVNFVEAAPEPFFLLAQPTAPHPPMQAPEAYLDRFNHLEHERRRCYAAMMACLDDGFGALMQAVQARGLADRTAVIFASDHGWDVRPVHAGASDNGGLRGGKYRLTEGGLRVPCIAAGPGLAPGVRDEPAWAVDLNATVLDWAGLPHDGEGRSLLVQPEERTFAWQFNDVLVKTGEQRAALRGRWKWLLEDGGEALYDVVADPGETVDRGAELPHTLQALKADWDAWWT